MLTNQDKKLICRDCERDFIFSARMQKQFSEQSLNPPTRCPQCHDKRTSRRKYSRGGACEIHTAACSLCGKDADLPFKPTPGKPVYCDECFKGRFTPARSAVNQPERIHRNDDLTAGVAAFAHLKLDQRLNSAVREAGYGAPTPVQAAAIPVILKGRDLIGTAQTGTGKTAAFVLPILQYLLTNPAQKQRTRVVVLTPTRELAEQINGTFKQLGKYTQIKSATVYGGVAMNPQEKALRNGTDVIVACPGRLLDHMDRGNTNFSEVTKLVLDEADRMLDMGFLPSIKRIISRLPENRHSMLFSATFAAELTRFTGEVLKNPQRVEVDVCAPATTIAHALYPCPQHLKTSLVLDLLDKTDVNSVLIFTRTKHRANRVARQIASAGYTTAALHADRSQNQRQLALDSFRSGQCQILVATDIAARGLDVATVSHVINYDIPATADDYIHRIGRTGRMKREGDAMTLVTPLDASVVFDIEKALGAPIERRQLEAFDYNAPPPEKKEANRTTRAHHKQAGAAKASSETRPAAKPKSPTRAGHYAGQRN